MSKRVFWKSIIVTLSLALCITFSGYQAGAEELKTVKIGHLGDWTGPAGRTCGPPGDALIAYFHEYVNKEKGGIPYLDPKTGKELGRVKTEVLFADCRYELPLFKSAFRNFVDKGIVIVHTTSSPAVEGLKRDYKRDKVPLLMSTSNTVGLWPPEWIYGLRESFADDMGVYVDWILENWKKKRPPRVALLYYDGPLGKSMLWGGPQYAKKKGIEIVASEPLPGMIMDSTSQLLRAKQGKADFIIAHILGSMHAVVRKDMKRLGIKIPYGTCFNTDAAELVELAGDAVEGAYFIWDSAPAQDESKPAAKWRNERYRKYMKGRPGYNLAARSYPDGVWCLGWHTAMAIHHALALALQKVHPNDLTGEKVKNLGINRFKDWTARGLLNPINYKPGVDQRGAEYTYICQVKDGKGEIIAKRKVPRLLPHWMKKKK